MKTNKVIFQSLKMIPKRTIKKLEEFGLTQKTIENVFPVDEFHYKNVKRISEDTVSIDNVDRKLVHNHIWTAATEFYNSLGDAPYQEILLTKTENGLKKTIFNVFLETTKPWDGIETSYKAIRAMSPKKEQIFL